MTSSTLDPRPLALAEERRLAGAVADTAAEVPDGWCRAYPSPAVADTAAEVVAEVAEAFSVDPDQGLSAGEAQLLAFTRIFLQDPGLVILDEASSRLDPATENLIERAVDTLVQDRTAIIIAHRLSTVKNADRIVVLEQGTIIEEGTHDQLLAQGGHYATLYNTYFRHQELDYDILDRKERSLLQ